MVIFPKAKINIGLRITEKRTDGFHNLETIFYPVCLCDAIEFVVPELQLKADSLKITGLLADSYPHNNLVMKAILRLRGVADFPFLSMHLHKAIPAGAGLGGGSSDAAAILKAVNRYFNLEIRNDILREISLELGSDCPFFLEGTPAYAEGRGEILTPLNPVAEELYLLMVNPGIHINTREAYSNCTPKRPMSDLMELYKMDMSAWKDLIVNDFEESVFRKYPQLAGIKDTLYNTGAVYSSMTGSGSTVYGIFKEKPEIPESIRDQIIYSDIL